MQKKSTNTKSKSVNKKGGSSKMMGSAAGAIIGAAIGGVAGAALSDSKTRKNVGQLASEVTEFAADVMDTPVEMPTGPSTSATPTKTATRK